VTGVQTCVFRSVVPDAWHHTNTDLYGHLPVTKVLKEVLGA
jgi:hypothetical protein